MSLSFVLYCGVQFIVILKLKGGWLIVAALPLIAVGMILTSTIIGAIQGAAQFPVVMLLTAPPLLVYVILVFLSFKIYTFYANNN